MCGPRRAKNNSSCAAFRCAMARERDRAPQIRTTGRITYSWSMMITWWMKLEGNLPPGHDALLLLISGTGFVCPVAQTWLDIPRPKVIYPVVDNWGRKKSSGTRLIRTAELSVHSRTWHPPDHDDLPKSGSFLPIGGSSAKTAPPCVGHRAGARYRICKT